tara:strand:- start:300 stop:593 length:294 start_codon:yes stop_codon:yes gene_type:complete
VDVEFPHEPFNTFVKAGTAGEKIQAIMGELKPEAAYFTERDGVRGGILVVDLADPSKIPSIAEPLFLTSNAKVKFQVVMTPEDLGAAGLDELGRKWG